MGLFTNFFKAKPDRKPSDAPADPVALSHGRVGNVRGVIQFSTVLDAAKAMEHPVVYRCVNKIAESVQQVRWYCEPDPMVTASEQAPARKIQAINAVLNSPNDLYAADQLRYWIAMNYCLYGRVPFKIGVSVNGSPNGLYPLTTRFVKVEFNKAGRIVEFIYGSGTDEQKIPPRQAVEENGLLTRPYAYAITKPNLDGSLLAAQNACALAAIGLPAAVISLLLQRAVDTASGHPNVKYVITASKTLTKAQKNELGQHLNEDSAPGSENSGNILILYNTDAKIDKLDNSLADIHSKMPMDDMTRMIAAAFGVPVALIGLGAADAAKFASNYTESRRAFWADTIVPGYLTPIATGLTAALCPYGARISFDLDTIDALRDHNIENAKNLEKVPFLTPDEKRELIGFPKIEGGDKLTPAEPAQPTPPNE